MAFALVTRCPQETDVRKLHKEEMEKAADEAKKKYLAEHPESSSTVLKYDPLKKIEPGKLLL